MHSVRSGRNTIMQDEMLNSRMEERASFANVVQVDIFGKVSPSDSAEQPTAQPAQLSLAPKAASQRCNQFGVHSLLCAFSDGGTLMHANESLHYVSENKKVWKRVEKMSTMGGGHE